MDIAKITDFIHCGNISRYRIKVILGMKELSEVKCKRSISRKSQEKKKFEKKL